MTSNPPTIATSTGSDDEKSHTFRKRRLSLSRHNINLDSTGTGTGPDPGTYSAGASVDNNSHTNSLDNSHTKFNEGEAETDKEIPPLPVIGAPSAELDQKAQTFRKRRLSLTLKLNHEEEDADPHSDQQLLEPALEGQGQGEGQEQAEEPIKRQRRASDASTTSLGSQQTGDGLRVRTLHAGEITTATDAGTGAGTGTGADTGTTTTNANIQNQPHVLYRMSRPSSMSLLQQATPHQPKWKKRITRKHDEDERKLPFPRDIVGTYSCHGVEPVYDSDYEQEPMEDQDDDGLDADNQWTGLVSTAAPKSKQNKQQQQQPKPTTAAKINQDRGGVAFPYGNCPKTALFAAYDGHGQGGELVSQFALHEIQSRLEKRPEFNSNLEKAFKDTFLQVDEDLQNEPLIEPLYAGTTACVALLRETTLTVANAGDSRAVIARRDNNNNNTTDNNNNNNRYQAIDLTIDQNPDLPEERSRIEGMGGFVSPPPEPGLSARVWLDEGFSQIGLAMARSIGDHAVARVGVIAEPVVTSHQVTPQDEFLIIATDGVWEFLSSQTAVEIVGANLARGATKATQALIEAAAARWHDEEGDYRDDITALVVRLSELWKDHSASTSAVSQEAPAASPAPAE